MAPFLPMPKLSDCVTFYVQFYAFCATQSIRFNAPGGLLGRCLKIAFIRKHPSDRWVRDTEVEEPRCARQSRERKRAVAGTSSEIAGCDPSPPLSYVRGSACCAPSLGFSRMS